jgi:(S)-mandelate dehydrogenase
MDRAAAVGVSVLVVTVDVPTPGKRERDLANHWTIQPRLTVRNSISFAAHPLWAARLAARPRVFAKKYADE